MRYALYNKQYITLTNIDDMYNVNEFVMEHFISNIVSQYKNSLTLSILQIDKNNIGKIGENIQNYPFEYTNCFNYDIDINDKLLF